MPIPDHILEKAANDPRVQVMEWKFDQVLEPLSAATVGCHTKVIHHEHPFISVVLGSGARPAPESVGTPNGPGMCHVHT